MSVVKAVGLGAMKICLRDEIKNVTEEEEVIPEDSSYRWLLGQPCKGQGFLPGVRFPVICSLMQRDGVGSAGVTRV